MLIKTSKRIFILLMMLVVILVVAACEPDRGQNVAQSDPGENGETEKPKELVVWVNDEEVAQEAAKEMFKKYTEETGIEVKLEAVPMPDQVQKLALAAPAGDGPDLFYQPHDRLGDVVAQGLATPINYTEEELSEYSEAAIDAFTYEGEIYGAPVAIDTYFIYYNKSLVKEVPTTIDGVFELSKELTNREKDEFGFLISPEFYYLYSFINSNGGYIFGENDGVYDVKDIGLDNEGSVQGFKDYMQFVEAGLIPKTVTVDVLDGLFSEGKVGMVVSGPWNIAVYRDALGDDLATAPLPQMGGKPAPSFVGVKSWLVSSYSENKEWAMDLAKFLTNDENAQLNYDIAGELPPRPAVLDAVEDSIYDGYTQQIVNGTPMPNIPEMSAVWDMDDAIQLIINGEDIEEVLQETVQNIKDKIELY